MIVFKVIYLDFYTRLLCFGTQLFLGMMGYARFLFSLCSW